MRLKTSKNLLWMNAIRLFSWNKIILALDPCLNWIFLNNEHGVWSTRNSASGSINLIWASQLSAETKNGASYILCQRVMQCSKYILICIWKNLNSVFDDLKHKRAKTFLFYVGPHPHMRFGHLQMLRNPWSRFDINACYYSGLIAQQARPAGVIMKTGPQSPSAPLLQLHQQPMGGQL